MFTRKFTISLVACKQIFRYHKQKVNNIVNRTGSMDLFHISQILKQARLTQQLTMDQLSARTGLSKTFISRLENFRITPSLNALSKVAQSLGVNMADLFTPEAKPQPVVFGRINEGEPIDRDDGNKFGLAYFALAYKKLDREINPFLIEYTPSEKQREFLMHPTDEFFVLLSGKVDFYTFDESNCKTLKKGDTSYLSKNIPHTVYLHPGQNKAQALVIYGQESSS